MPERDITLSTVRNHQTRLVTQLIEDHKRACPNHAPQQLKENVEDSVPLATSALSCPVERIVNQQVKGFGANHNAAFTRCRTPYFCVVNPDIRLPTDPFPPLVQALSDPRVAVAAPLVRNPAGGIEDSARRFPTFPILLRKALGGRSGPDYPTDKGPVEVDWAAGMFLLFRSKAFRSVRGFDERYFMYYEDVDLGRRLRMLGMRVMYAPASSVVHNARRGSRRNAGLALHHLRSVLRFFSQSH
jgi:GT2 family glycosyltransferase